MVLGAKCQSLNTPQILVGASFPWCDDFKYVESDEELLNVFLDYDDK